MSLDVDPSGESIAGIGHEVCSISDINTGTQGFQIKFEHQGNYHSKNSYL